MDKKIKMHKPMKARGQIVAIMLAVIISAGCGHYPEPIRSVWDIFWTSKSESALVLCSLKLHDWPKLQKFGALTQLRIAEEMAPAITDEHLHVLSMLQFQFLRDVSFAQCQHVTDAGINCLTNIPSIESLQLIGVGITDEGLKTLALRMPYLKGINIWRCRLLTVDGILGLKSSSSIDSVGFSTDNFSQTDVERLVSEVSNVTWWTLDDRLRRLSLTPLQQMAKKKGIRIQLLDGNCIKGIDEIITAGYETKPGE